MKLKQAWAWSTIFSLLLPPVIARGQTAINQEALSLLAHHSEMTTGPEGLSLSKKYGRDLNKVTAAFLSDPKNKSFLNQPEFVELKHKNTLLENYLFLNDQFDNCIKDKTRVENYSKRLLDNGLNSSIENYNPCLSTQNILGFKEIDKLAQSFSQLEIHSNGPRLKKDLERQMTLNSALSLMGYKYKFDPNFMKDKELSSNDLASIEKEICNYPIRGRFVDKRDFCESFGKDFKAHLNIRLKDYAKKLSSNEIKFSPKSATEELNKSLESINSNLSAIRIQKESGLLFSSPNLEDQEAKKQYDHYVENYLKLVSSGPGSLLLSETIKDKSGHFKSFAEDDLEKKNNHYVFLPHKKISIADTDKAIKEVGEKINKQIYALKEKSTNQAQLKMGPYVLRDSIDDIVKMNPFAAGEMLLNKPQYVTFICDSINRINSKEESRKKHDDFFMVGSAVLGGTLLLTGIGTVVGGYLLTGTLTSGIAAGTFGGGVLGFSALAGGSAEALAITYYGKKAYSDFYQSENMELAFLSKNSDVQSIIEAKESLNSYKEARLIAGIALAGLGINGFNAGRIFNLFKSQAHVTPAELKNATSILNKISETAVAEKISSTLALFKSAGAEKIDNFFMMLTQAAEPTRIRLLQALNNSKLTPEKLKEIIETSLIAAKKCSLR